MRFLLLPIFILVGFVFIANAQLCGSYSTTLIVTDEAGTPIENTVIEIVPLQEEDFLEGKNFARENDNVSRFSISFNEGYKVKGFYRIRVSANGYFSEITKIYFPHCRKQEFKFKLRKGENINPTLLTGTVSNEFGVIPQTKVKFQNKNGKTFETVTDDEGKYYFELPEGMYTIEFNATGFKPHIINDYIIALNREMELDAVLEIGQNINTITVTSNCNFGITDN